MRPPTRSDARRAGRPAIAMRLASATVWRPSAWPASQYGAETGGPRVAHSRDTTFVLRGGAAATRPARFRETMRPTTSQPGPQHDLDAEVPRLPARRSGARGGADDSPAAAAMTSASRRAHRACARVRAALAPRAGRATRRVRGVLREARAARLPAGRAGARPALSRALARAARRARRSASSRDRCLRGCPSRAACPPAKGSAR